MSKSEKLNAINRDLSPIKELIDKKKWAEALKIVQEQFINYEKEENALGMDISGGYKNYITAKKELGKMGSQSHFTRALILFPEEGFELERFNCHYALALILFQQNKMNLSMDHYLKAWRYAKTIDSELKLDFLNKIIPLFLENDRSDKIVDFLKEKLPLIDKETDETEYFKTIILLITFLMQRDELGEVLNYYQRIKENEFLPVKNIEAEIETRINGVIERLIKRKKYEDAIEFIETNKLGMDLFLPTFRPLYDAFLKKPSLKLATTLVKLLTTPLTQQPAKEIRKLWEKNSRPEISKLLSQKPLNLVERVEYRPMIEFILKDETLAEHFVFNISALTETLLIEPSNKEIMAFLLYLNEVLQDRGLKNSSFIVHSWISTAIDLRKSIGADATPIEIEISHLITRDLPKYKRDLIKSAEDERIFLTRGFTSIGYTYYAIEESYKKGSFSKIILTNKRILFIWKPKDGPLRWREVRLNNIKSVEFGIDRTNLVIKGEFNDEQNRGLYQGTITLILSNISEKVKWKNEILSSKKQRGPLYKPTVSKPHLNKNLILNIFKRTRGTFAPNSIIRNYFEEMYKDHDYTASVTLCNVLSEFLEEFSVIIYGFPDSPKKSNLLKVIDEYTNTIASGYEFIILDRMKQQNIDVILALGPGAQKTVIDTIVGTISIKNPSPFTRCLDNTLNRWRSFPVLEKTIYDSYQTREVALKPVFWMLIFNFIYMAHLDGVYRRLPKNEELHHRNLVELIRAFINFFYNFQKCVDLDSSIPSSNFPNFRRHTVDWLKKMNDMIKFTDDELREIVLASHWRGESSSILSKVIEAKNYCLYCSYNMPLGSKKCPNCGREVKEVPFEPPSIDFSAMGSFFDKK